MRTEYDKNGMEVFFSAVKLLREDSNCKEVSIPIKQLNNLLNKTPLSVPDNEAINHFRIKSPQEVIEDLNRFIQDKNLFTYYAYENEELRILKSSLMVYEDGKINPEITVKLTKKEDEELISMIENKLKRKTYDK